MKNELIIWLVIGNYNQDQEKNVLMRVALTILLNPVILFCL